MSGIRTIDMLLLDELFDMGQGYVLNFSDKTLPVFFAEELNVDIDHQRYRVDGNSKAKRTRCYLRTVNDQEAVRALNALWNYRNALLINSGQTDPIKSAEGRFLALTRRLEGKPAIATAATSSVPAHPAFDWPRLRDLKVRLVEVSKMPPQPRGVWNSVYNREKWKDAAGPDRYRRAIYTFVKRTSGYPSFLIFDASDRTTSLARRIPTNTPLQALVTLNDPVYDEAAEALANRALREVPKVSGRSLVDARIMFEARLVLSRDPTARELTVLRGLFEKTTAAANQPALQPASLRLQELSESDPKATSSKLEGLKAVGNALLNLDAAMIR